MPRAENGGPKLISLRSKLTAVMLALFAVYGVLIAALSNRVLLGGYLALERSDSAKDLRRVQGAIRRELAYLGDFCLDWSRWDESYDFIKTADAEFIEANLYDDYVYDSKLALAYFLDKSGRVVWGTGFEASKGRRYAHPRFEGGSLPVDDPLIAFGNGITVGKTGARTGFLKAGEGILLVSSAPVVHSNGEGPVIGFLVFGKLLDEAEVKKTTELDISLVPLADRGDKDRLLSGLRADGPNFLSDTPDQRRLYSIFEDLDGEPAFAVLLRYPREIFRQGLALIRMSFGLLIAIGLCVLALSSAALGSLVLRPMRLMLAAVERATESEDYSLRLGIARRDEIGALAAGFDALMATVKARTGALEELNRKLEVMADTDQLTELPNRRRFDRHIDMELRRVARNSRGVPHRGYMSFILCDIDHFKLFNDTYGHQAGDECLARVAAVLKDCARRPDDLAARLGGEEFAIVLPDTDLEGARVVAEKVRNGVLGLAVEHRLSPVLPIVTISQGIACMSPSDQTTPREIIAQADQALYQAKAKGRNRVVSL